MTLPYLAVAWLSGIYLQSVLSLPAWIVWLATPLLVAIIFLWWREWRVRLGASCALLGRLLQLPPVSRSGPRRRGSR